MKKPSAQKPKRKERPAKLRILLIEDNPGDVNLLRRILTEDDGLSFHVESADRLEKALERIGKGDMDVILLDLHLPDSQGIDTFARVHIQAPNVPVIVLSGMDDESVAIRAVRRGAQDYLVKGQVNGKLLVRAMRYAVERQQMVTGLRVMSLFDELTGLYNRRGFLTLGRQQLKLAKRTKKELLLLFADLDNLKWINDHMGHHEGDSALIETANVLKRTFRESDVVARIGGDEFAIIAIEAHRASAEPLSARLQRNLKARNAQRDNHRYNLSVSMGLANYDPAHPCSLEELLARADSMMYEQKRKKPKAYARA